MSLKEFSEQATLYKDDTLAIEQTLLMNERDDGKLEAQRITLEWCGGMEQQSVVLAV
jgi:hypothetical protein